MSQLPTRAATEPGQPNPLQAKVFRQVRNLSALVTGLAFVGGLSPFRVTACFAIAAIGAIVVAAMVFLIRKS
jgi:hypothetical protein